MNQKSYFNIKDSFEIKDFERKKQLAELRFNLAMKLAKLMDDFAIKRHNERCQILGIKYNPQKKSIISMINKNALQR